MKFKSNKRAAIAAVILTALVVLPLRFMVSDFRPRAESLPCEAHVTREVGRVLVHDKNIYSLMVRAEAADDYVLRDFRCQDSDCQPVFRTDVPKDASMYVVEEYDGPLCSVQTAVEFHVHTLSDVSGAADRRVRDDVLLFE